MGMQLAFEYLSLALEGTRFTAEGTPDTLANVVGMVRHRKSYYSPDDSDGRLAQSRGDKVTRKWCEWSGEGPLDTAVLPYYLEMLTKSGISPSTPGGTNPRLWDYDPDMDADSVKLATIWWGDPNVEEWRAAGCFIEELRIVNDATGTSGATMSVRGQGTYPDTNSPTNPAADVDDIIVPMNMQLWIDTGGDSIGTTEVTGRILRAEHVIPSGIRPKFIPPGGSASSDLTYTDIGFRKRQGNNRAVTRIRLEVPDTTEWDLFDADTPVKLRVRHNGANIETTYYHYVEVDMYGLLRFQDWGEAFETNRVVNLELYSEYDSDLGADYRVAVQNTETAL